MQWDVREPAAERAGRIGGVWEQDVINVVVVDLYLRGCSLSHSRGGADRQGYCYGAGGQTMVHIHREQPPNILVVE